MLILVLKQQGILNTHKNCRFKVSTLKLGAMIALFVLNLNKLIFIEVGEPTFLGDSWKNRANNEKRSKFLDV